MQASACGARRALGEDLVINDVSSAPTSRQGLRLSVQTHPGGVCDGGRGANEAPMTLSVLLIVVSDRPNIMKFYQALDTEYKEMRRGEAERV